jgi:hypothetical protein
MSSHDVDSPPGMPLWAKILGIALLVLVLAFAVMAASGHGPGHHLS